MKNIGIIGTGYMGTAVMRGILKTAPHVQFGMVEKDGSRRDYCTRELGALDFTAKPAELFGFSDMVILAIKPQDLESLADSIGKIDADSLILSMLAGTPITRIGGLLGVRRIIRIMPNLAADIGKAVTGITFSREIEYGVRTEVHRILQGLGTLLEVREDQLAAVTGISGSGIAFALEFIDALAMGGVLEGLPYGQAVQAARDVVESAAALMKESESSPSELVRRVCSPGGTTVQGVRALKAGQFDATVMTAVEAAARRSRELEG